MPSAPPLPYGLVVTPRFPFPALAAATRTAVLGGPRETVLACLQGARLAVATLPPYALSGELRRRRADAALGWLAALALPGELRPALTALYTAAARGASPALGDALRAVVDATASALSSAATAELSALAEAVDRSLATGDIG